MADLVGSDDVLRRLSLLSVSSVMSPLPIPGKTPALTLPSTATLREALGLPAEFDSGNLIITDMDNRPVGTLDLHAIKRATNRRKLATNNRLPTTMDYIFNSFDRVWPRLVEHVYLSGISLAIAVLIALPLGLLLNRQPKVATPVLTVLGIIYTIQASRCWLFLSPCRLSA